MTRFLATRDRHDRLRFVALQSETGRAWVQRFGEDPDALTTFYVVVGFEGDAPRLLARGRAALFVLAALGWPWRAAGILRPLPTRLLDAAYGFVARRRYRWFGQLDACLVPTPALRAKFLD